MAVSIESHRPRNLDWKRAAAFLYGDWGTSKAYVVGIVFATAAFASLPTILAVCLITGLVGINYAVICRYFPDGGGVYSAARGQSRMLAVIGALLLVADLTVTAALSGWEAMRYFNIGSNLTPFATMIAIVGFGLLNSYGPRHSGGIAMWLAVPTVGVVILLICLSLPHLTTANLERPHENWAAQWVHFTAAILALSGVEAIANLTGVLKLDPGSTPQKPKVSKEASKAIFPVALEVTVGTALLGWAMLSLPKHLEKEMEAHHESMLRYMGEYYGTFFGDWLKGAAEHLFGSGFGSSLKGAGAHYFGPQFLASMSAGQMASNVIGMIIGIVMGLLLLSAVNTAIAAMIGVMYMLARDGEMPRPFQKLNRYGVPELPLILAVALPIVVLCFTLVDTKGALQMLAGLYAIGVVGAIAVNLGSCTFNKELPLKWHERGLFAFTFIVLFGVEITLAYTKHDALFFVLCVVAGGLSLRAWSHKVSGLETVTVAREVADLLKPETVEAMRPQLEEGQRILVAAQGLTPVMNFALDETQLRKGMLYVLYVKKVAVTFAQLPGERRQKWEDDPRASAIMSVMMKQGMDREITVVPLFAVSDDPAAVILDFAATLGVDYLFLGGSHRQRITSLLAGDVISQVAAALPEEIRLVIYG